MFALSLRIGIRGVQQERVAQEAQPPVSNMRKGELTPVFLFLPGSAGMCVQTGVQEVWRSQAKPAQQGTTQPGSEPPLSLGMGHGRSLCSSMFQAKSKAMVGAADGAGTGKPDVLIPITHHLEEHTMPAPHLGAQAGSCCR